MRKHLVNISLLFVTCLIVLAIAEMIIRFSNIAYEPQYDNRVKITRKSNNPIIAYELIPNFSGMALGGRINVNSSGFRGPEVSREKPDEVTRIAVLGDSWAFGWGVNQDEVFTSILEKQLNGSYQENKFEVLNFSLFGYNFQQQETLLNEKVLAFKPDIVIFAFNINDLEDIKLISGNNVQVKKGKEIDGDTKGKMRFYDLIRNIEKLGNEYSHIFRLIDTSLRGLAISMHIDKPEKELYFKKLYENDAPACICLSEAFQRISRLSSENNFDVCIFYLPWMQELSQNNPYEETFEKVSIKAGENGFFTLNLFPFFKGRDVRKLRISNIDGHPTARGHRIAADAITEFLLRNMNAMTAAP